MKTREERIARIRELKGYCEDVLRRSALVSNTENHCELEAGLDNGKPGTLLITVRCAAGAEFWRMHWPRGASTYEWRMTQGPGIS